MRPPGLFTLSTLILSTYCLAQDDLPIFKTEAKSAFVWGEDVPSGAASSLIRDPITGAETLKLRHAGVEVSSRVGFERRRGEIPELIAFTTTIVNNSNKALSVKYGRASIDGHIVTPLSIFSGTTEPRGKRVYSDPNRVDVAKLYCFSSGFLSHDNFFQLGEQVGALAAEAQSSITVSTIIKDPRPYPMLCSVDGCLPKGTIGYSIQVGSQDFIFIRPGRKLVDCGKADRNMEAGPREFSLGH